MSEGYTVLDLFCGVGGFSAAFQHSDRWKVTTVDINEDFNPDICADIMKLTPADFRDSYDVVLASPPCQYLNTAGNHDKWNFDQKAPTSPESKNAVALFHHTVGLIHALSPDYYYIENPRRSRIQWSFRKPDEWVTYCQYGQDYQKPTGLWGEFAAMTFKRCSSGSSCHSSNTESDGTEAIASMNHLGQAERSCVPYKLSESIRDACESALDGGGQTRADDWL
jgi:hypothetical protein